MLQKLKRRKWRQKSNPYRSKASTVFFSGFTRISKPSSNEIKNKIINIIESTEGNLQVMDANRNQLGDFIGQHEKIDKGIDSLKFAEARVPLRDTTETLKRELLELTNLSTKIQKCFGEK